MNNKCFNGAPDSLHESNQNIYSSSFIEDSMYPSQIHLSCRQYNAINVLFIVFTAIAGTGLIGPAALFIYKSLSNIKTTKKSLLSIFKDIIGDFKTQYDKKEITEEECAHQIYNAINDRMIDEYQCATYERVFISTLNQAIDEEWSTIHKKYRTLIIDKSFIGIEFKRCCKCHSKSLNSTKEGSELSLLSGELNETLI